MSKGSNQKLKLSILCKIMQEKTDDEHSLTLAQIIKELQKYDITAERKSLYDDFKCMEENLGIEVIKEQEGRETYYHVGSRTFELGEYGDIDSLKKTLNNIIEEDFGLNSMHMVRIDGEFNLIDARSESPYRSIHVSLKTVLEQTQKAFCFENIRGTLVCVYFPDYMDGINAPGWHLHFVSEDRQKGGHVFEMSMKSGSGTLDKINSIEIKLPDEPVFDTYSLKEASGNEIKQVEQGKS